MLFFYKFVLASVVFVSSVIANPATSDTYPAECTNDGVLLTKDFGRCIVTESKGILSAAECLNENGVHYYCIIDGSPYCLPVSGAPEGVDNGECF